MADPRKFRYNSDFHSPAFVWKDNFTITTGTGSGTTWYEVEHNLPYTPLLCGVWRYKENDGEWSNYLNVAGGRNFYFSNTGTLFSEGTFRLLQVIANGTKVRVGIFKAVHSAVTNPHIITGEFHLFAFAPYDFSGPVVGIEDYNKFRVNSDEKRSMITQETWIDVPANTTTEYNHGLGYVPIVRWWRNADGDWLDAIQNNELISWGGTDLRFNGIRVDEDKVYISNGLSTSQRYYIQIFGSGTNET